MRPDLKLFPDNHQWGIIIFTTFIFLAPTSYLLLDGLWAPFRLHATGKIDFDIVEGVTYHPPKIRPNNDSPPYYSISTRRHNSVDYHLGQDFIYKAKTGDTIIVFVSDDIDYGYRLPDNHNGSKPTLLEVLNHYKFQVFFDVLIVLALLGILSRITYYVILLMVDDTKKKHEKEQGLFVSVAIATSLINIFVYLILAVVFEFFIIESAFYVEGLAVWLSGIVILAGSYIVVISPLLIYKFRKYVVTSENFYWKISRELVLFFLGTYAIFKLFKSITEKKIINLNGFIEIVIKLLESIFKR